MKNSLEKHREKEQKEIYSATKDTEPPLVDNEENRLYGHNLCPYTARARYALAAAGIKFSECYIDLNVKLEWKDVEV